MPRVRRKSRAARLTELEREHNKALDTIAAAKYGPIHKSESSYISSERSKARRQQSGFNRAGKTSTVSGRKSYARMRKTPTEQRRADVEREVQDFIRRNPDHPVAKQWQARLDEIERLTRQETPEPEEMFGGQRRVHVRAYAQVRPPRTDIRAYTRRWPRLVRRRGAG
jgi:hypothetical protein